MEIGHAREHICYVSAELFAKQGYHATSIREIAQASGILSGSLYAHIRSKEDLLYDIVHGIATSFVGGIEPIAESQLNPFKKLHAGLRFHVSIVVNHLQMVTVYYNEWRMLSDVRRIRIKNIREKYEAYWASIVQECMRRNACKDSDERAVTLVILSSTNWLYQWYSPSSQITPEDIADRFYEVIIGGMRDSEELVKNEEIGG